jgi:hypothetical protein
VHWKAHPMFQLAAVVVKTGLVQSPLAWVGPSSNLGGEETGDEVGVVVWVGVEVVVDEPAVMAVVEVVPAPDPPASVVVLSPAEPDSAGNVDGPLLVLALDEAGVPTV